MEREKAIPRYSTTAELADLLEERAVHTAEAVIATQLEMDPEMAHRYGAHERRKAVEDATHTLKTLAEAVANDDPATFLRYITWLDEILRRVGLPRSDLGRHLVLLREHLLREVPGDLAALLHAFLDPAVKMVMPGDEVGR